MRVVTAGQMKKIDQATIRGGVKGLTLMERAGRGIFELITGYYEVPENLHVSIFLGKGNNAGDGLVVARLLAETGAEVVLYYLHRAEEFSPDASANYSRLETLREKKRIKEILLYRPGWEGLAAKELEKSDLVIDALLGTGINSPVRDKYLELIELINNSPLPVLSVDIPSGVNGTTAEIMGAAVKADLTATMALPKFAALFNPGKSNTGDLEVVDIGVPENVIEESGLKVHMLDALLASADFPLRSPEAHKFECGSLLVVAGSRRYSGAAQLSALSALKTGCGIVYMAGPESIRGSVQSAAPEIIFVSLPETQDGSISKDALGVLNGKIRYDAAAIGPGLTTDEETAGFIKDFVSRCRAPVLLDADAINSFEGDYETLLNLSRDKEIVLTPHSGELRRLTGKKVPETPEERIKAISSLIEGSRITLVHKGSPTLVALPDGNVYVNVPGHPGQATAGSGDVLTGTIGGLLAQSCSGESASRLGVYIHSRAADIAAFDYGERSMIAGDCLRAVPRAVKEIENVAGCSP
ncbi:MAG: NAD(P)H-hydrate dehydratase [Candidatus Krumholzibacteriota bacterium]|nr:NAD(P)H-hydrate dehydratase [Candidatus Krumholzibacteriota bacterium]